MCFSANPRLGKNSQVVSEYPSKSPATAWITAYASLLVGFSAMRSDASSILDGSVARGLA